MLRGDEARKRTEFLMIPRTRWEGAINRLMNRNFDKLGSSSPPATVKGLGCVFAQRATDTDVESCPHE